jgi:glucokinase
MTDYSLIGDIGGTNSRFALVKAGAMEATRVQALKNDNFPSLEAAIQAYLGSVGITALEAAAIAVAAPVDREQITLTNRDWTFSARSLAAAANARRVRLLNDYEALALALPHLKGEDVVQVGGEPGPHAGVKIVMGPGTGLGMAALSPTPGGGWLVLPCEPGHASLPVETQEEFDWRAKMRKPGAVFTSEDAITGGGLFLMYKTLDPAGPLKTPEAVLQAALAGSDTAAEKTLAQFIVWLARVCGDAAVMLQARGGVYLAGGIAPSIIAQLRSSTFRSIFEEKGKLAYVMRPIPIFVIVDKFPAFKGCAAALRA